MTKYKSTNGVQTGFVPGVGEIVNGVIEAPENWQHNNLFEKVVEQPKVAPAVPTASPTPEPLTPPAIPTQTKETK